MSTTYIDLDNTNYPDSIDNYDLFLDPTAESLSLINQYYTYFDTGNLTSATALLEANPTLKQMIINADNMNKFRDSILAIERFYFSDVQQYLQDIVKFKGTYDVATKYVKYNVVGYTVGSAIEYFMCKDATTPIGTSPTNTTYFVPLTLRGEQGISGTGLSPRGGWLGTIQYYTNDCVAYNSKLWYALADNVNSEPTDVNTNWAIIMEYHQSVITSSTEPVGQAVGDMWYEII